MLFSVGASVSCITAFVFLAVHTSAQNLDFSGPLSSTEPSFHSTAQRKSHAPHLSLYENKGLQAQDDDESQKGQTRLLRRSGKGEKPNPEPLQTPMPRVVTFDEQKRFLESTQQLAAIHGDSTALDEIYHLKEHSDDRTPERMEALHHRFHSIANAERLAATPEGRKLHEATMKVTGGRPLSDFPAGSAQHRKLDSIRTSWQNDRLQKSSKLAAVAIALPEHRAPLTDENQFELRQHQIARTSHQLSEAPTASQRLAIACLDQAHGLLQKEGKGDDGTRLRAEQAIMHLRQGHSIRSLERPRGEHELQGKHPNEDLARAIMENLGLPRATRPLVDPLHKAQFFGKSDSPPGLGPFQTPKKKPSLELMGESGPHDPRVGRVKPPRQSVTGVPVQGEAPQRKAGAPPQPTPPLHHQPPQMREIRDKFFASLPPLEGTREQGAPGLGENRARTASDAFTGENATPKVVPVARSPFGQPMQQPGPPPAMRHLGPPPAMRHMGPPEAMRKILEKYLPPKPPVTKEQGAPDLGQKRAGAVLDASIGKKAKSVVVPPEQSAFGQPPPAMRQILEKYLPPQPPVTKEQGASGLGKKHPGTGLDALIGKKTKSVVKPAEQSAFGRPALQPGPQRPRPPPAPAPPLPLPRTLQDLMAPGRQVAPPSTAPASEERPRQRDEPPPSLAQLFQKPEKKPGRGN